MLWRASINNHNHDFIEHVTFSATSSQNARMKSGLWALFLGYGKINQYRATVPNDRWAHGWHRFYGAHWECRLSNRCKLWICCPDDLMGDAERETSNV